MKKFHANLLKRYIERKEDSRDTDGQVGVAVLESNLNDTESDEEEDTLLTNPSLGKSESPGDVHISADFTPEQMTEVASLVREFPDDFTDKPGLTHLIEYDKNNY